MESVKKSIDERAQHKREYDSWVNERQIQTTEDKVDTGKERMLVWLTQKGIWTESKEQDTSSRSRRNDSTMLMMQIQTHINKTQWLRWKMVMLIPASRNSLPHAHAQSTKTFYKHQDSRIMKAQELKTKTSAQTLIYKIFLQRYQVYQGRLLASFQDDAKYEHVGQDTRSQGGKDDQDKQGKDLKISDIKTKSKDNDKGSRSKITKHEGTSLQRIQRPRPQDLNDKSNLINLMKECHNELTSGEIVSLKILSRTMEVRSLY
ncbi:hypothetical protein Tco_0177918 [Tanacetum coccineum]